MRSTPQGVEPVRAQRQRRLSKGGPASPADPSCIQVGKPGPGEAWRAEGPPLKMSQNWKTCVAGPWG